jgi:transcription antitermination factor NusG
MRAIASLADIPDDAWCVLRCQGRSTLRLADSLAKDGYEVWSPRETRKIRIPRMNVRREVILPLLPSYVFAKAHHLVDLLGIAQMPAKPRPLGDKSEPAHADFSVMHCFGKLPLIADRDLNGLRMLEVKLTPRKKADWSFKPGTEVKVEGGSFGGMIGNVQRSDNAHTLVCFSDKYMVKISTSLLLPNEVGRLLPCEGDAVRRAA